MDDLFRFLTIRPPQTPDVQGVDIALTSDYQKLLARFRTDNVRVLWQYVNQTVIQMNSPGFVSSPNNLKYPSSYDALRQSLDPVPPTVDRAALDKLVTAAFGKN